MTPRQKTRQENPFDIHDGSIKITYDIGHKLAEYFELDDLLQCSAVSYAYSRFFNEDLLWKRQLKKDFGISSNMFEVLCKHQKPKDVTAKAVYAWMKQLTTCPYRMPNYAKQLVKHSLHGELLVAIATDDSDTLLSLITPEEQPQWYEVALYAGCKNIPFRLYIEQGPEESVIRADYFAKAILAGHEDMYDYITKRDNTGLAPIIRHCSPAIRSGNATILKNVKLLCPDGFTSAQRELHDAICSGNLNQVKLMTNDEFGVEIDHADDKALDLACETGAIDICEFLESHQIKPNALTLSYSVTGGRRMLSYWLNKNNYYDSTIIAHLAMTGANKKLKRMLSECEKPITIDGVMLTGLAGQGEYESLRLILTSNKVKLTNKPNNETLNEAATSGCAASVDYLITHYKLTPDNNTLNSAASSGNLALVKQLVSKYKLTPDLNTLRHALLADSLAITEYLLDPQKEFYHLDYRQVLLLCSRDEGELTGNTALRTNLLPCHRFIYHALDDLSRQNDEHIDIQGFIENAAEMSPTYFCAMMKHIVSKPERYNLTEENVEWLKGLAVVEKALAPKDENQSNLSLSLGS